ncbi:MAG: DUF2231 domain-containing protein [Prolixibacteraceae bacterium]
MKNINIILVVLLILLHPFKSTSQEHDHTHSEEEEHSQNTEDIIQDNGHEDLTSKQDTIQQDTAGNAEEISAGIVPEEDQLPLSSESVFVPLSNFPTLHPLVVHFPFVLLYVALAAQLVGLFMRRNELMSWVTIVVLAGGFAGALLAMQVFHPHVSDLPPRVQKIFETHEYYASVTTWLAGIALFFKLISHFWMKRRMWSEIMIFLIITGSVITVSLAGHLGTQMAYIENVGPQGNYLEQNHEHEH